VLINSSARPASVEPSPYNQYQAVPGVQGNGASCGLRKKDRPSITIPIIIKLINYFVIILNYYSFIPLSLYKLMSLSPVALAFPFPSLLFPLPFALLVTL
jgi:hypothetical protein